MSMEYWNHVIFTDESKFNIFGLDGEKNTVWRKKYQIWKKQFIGVRKARSQLGIYGIMEHKLYIDILKQHRQASVNKIVLQDNYVFFQDPKHNSSL